MSSPRLMSIAFVVVFWFALGIPATVQAGSVQYHYMSCGGGGFRVVVEPRKNATSRVAVKFKPYSTSQTYKIKSGKWPGLKPGTCGIHNRKLKKGENIFLYETGFIKLCYGMLRLATPFPDISIEMGWPTDWKALALLRAIDDPKTTITFKVKRGNLFSKIKNGSSVGLIEIEDIVGIKKNNSSKWVQSAKRFKATFPDFPHPTTTGAPSQHCFKHRLEDYLGW
jgi:hypothetical protein